MLSTAESSSCSLPCASSSIVINLQLLQLLQWVLLSYLLIVATINVAVSFSLCGNSLYVAETFGSPHCQIWCDTVL